MCSCSLNPSPACLEQEQRLKIYRPNWDHRAEKTISLLFGSFSSYHMHVPYATPGCPQARKIFIMFILLREFHMLFQRISIVFCHHTIRTYAISSPIFPTRKASLCLSRPHKLHSPEITRIFTHFSSSLFSCFMFLFEKYFSSTP